MRTFVLALAAFALQPSGAFAQAAVDITAPLPPTLPWHGASERLVVRQEDPWITPIEATNFEETPSYAATCAWLERLVGASPLLRLEVFGHTAQGRRLRKAL